MADQMDGKGDMKQLNRMMFHRFKDPTFEKDV